MSQLSRIVLFSSHICRCFAFGPTRFGLDYFVEELVDLPFLGVGGSAFDGCDAMVVESIASFFKSCRICTMVKLRPMNENFDKKIL